MKFSEKWLREWVNPDLDSAELAHRLTMIGHEVESVEPQGVGIDAVVVAEVLEIRKHPDADRLNVCQVSTGNGSTIEVVCGASNLTVGMKSPFAAVGTTLPNGMKLRRAKIRGVVSNGMLCSAVELGLGDESDGIVELHAEAPVGQSLSQYLDLPDYSIDLDLTPNRGDCFSVMGIARDVSAMTSTAMKVPHHLSRAASKMTIRLNSSNRNIARDLLAAWSAISIFPPDLRSGCLSGSDAVVCARSIRSSISPIM